ncbi:hypothetical protein DM860_004209 [Cuscuta australis]|uniref:Prolamin-like domain-containing protein n=1 Tax=Cuscuta australis TaxID=267555 RepID=A0A328CVC4_9ASTE|nr:hypothetical protein DM860_004209 [Cuscuta australis]
MASSLASTSMLFLTVSTYLAIIMLIPPTKSLNNNNNNNNNNNVPKLVDRRRCWGGDWMDEDMEGCIAEANAFLGRELLSAANNANNGGLPSSPRLSLSLSTTCCMAFNEMVDRCAKDGFAFEVFIPPLVKEYCGFN